MASKVVNHDHGLIKFRYSKKVTIFLKISHFVLTLLSYFKKVVIFFKFCGLQKISEL